MAVFNAAKREIDIKIVYYGPALCGKTTNVQCVHKMLSPNQRGDIMSLATKDDRTLFFDFLPIELGDVKGFKTRFHVYTVPGQVYYALTRRAVLTGVDGVIFVADSQASKLDENIESLQDLNENLNYYKKDLSTIPFIIQYNKRDMDNILPVAELNQKINFDNVPYFASSAVDGTGVIETLTSCCKMVLKQMDSSGGGKKRRRQRVDEAASAAPPAAARPAAPSPTAAPSVAPPLIPFDDDDGPVITIIKDDDAKQAVIPAAPDHSRDFTASHGSGGGYLDDLQDIDSGMPAKPSFMDKPAPRVPVNATTQPRGPFDLDELPGTLKHESFDSFAPKATQPGAGFDLPLFDADVKKPLGHDDELPGPFQKTRAQEPATPATGSFAIAACGNPQQISNKSVNLPVKLKNNRTGQELNVTVTISFDDVSFT